MEVKVLEFSGKRILMVCQEGYSYPFYFLSKKWKKRNKLGAFFYGPAECMYKKCYFNRYSYFKFLELEDVELFDSKKISKYYSTIVNTDKIIDKKFLEEIEKKYTHFLGINEQVLSSQLFSRVYHWRNYYEYVSYSQQLNWLILNYKNIIDIINKFQPDMVLDDGQSELARTILLEVCWEKHIPYICLEHTRFDSYQIPNFSLGHTVDSYFLDAFNRNLNDEKALEKYCQIVRDWRNSKTIMTVENLRFFRNESLLNSLKSLYGHAVYYFDEDIKAGNRKLKKTNSIIYPNSIELMKYFTRIEYWKHKLSKKNKYFRIPQSEDIYVYMPLHLIPESTTFTKATQFINELATIEAVSKSLPAGWWLYVKEHHAMIGERGREFYYRVNKLPNVKMVQFNYYNDPKPWIINSKGVITISGTTAYEAAMLNIPSIVFADVPFQLIEGVYRLHSYEELRKTFILFKKKYDNINSCAAYIKAVEECGENIDITFLYEQGEKIHNHKISMNDEYKEQLRRLEKLFLKGFSIYFNKDI